MSSWVNFPRPYATLAPRSPSSEIAHGMASLNASLPCPSPFHPILFHPILSRPAPPPHPTVPHPSALLSSPLHPFAPAASISAIWVKSSGNLKHFPGIYKNPAMISTSFVLVVFPFIVYSMSEPTPSLHPNMDRSTPTGIPPPQYGSLHPNRDPSTPIWIAPPQQGSIPQWRLIPFRSP